jgi:hypothetical protein
MDEIDEIDEMDDWMRWSIIPLTCDRAPLA